MDIVLYIVNIILMATVVYFVTRKEEVPEKDDEYLIKGIVSELIENEESQIYKLLDKSDKTVKDFLEKTGEIKSSISGVCLLYTSPSPRDSDSSRMPSSA